MAKDGVKLLLSSEDFQSLNEKPSRKLIEFYIKHIELLLGNGALGGVVINIVDINEGSANSQNSEFMIVVSFFLHILYKFK